MRTEVEAASNWLAAIFIPGVDEADLKEALSQQLQACRRCRQGGLSRW